MSLEVVQYGHRNGVLDRSFIEQLILKLGDLFQVQIVWNQDNAVLVAACTVAGGFFGGYSGGRLGAVVGAGLGSITGLGVSVARSLREVWNFIKDQVQEIFFIVLNFLRRLDPLDYVNAVNILLSTYSSKKELVLSIIQFIAHKLGREVISSIASNSANHLRV